MPYYEVSYHQKYSDKRRSLNYPLLMQISEGVLHRESPTIGRFQGLLVVVLIIVYKGIFYARESVSDRDSMPWPLASAAIVLSCGITPRSSLAHPQLPRQQQLPRLQESR
jgi:hypothetical protein